MLIEKVTNSITDGKFVRNFDNTRMQNDRDLSRRYSNYLLNHVSCELERFQSVLELGEINNNLPHDPFKERHRHCELARTQKLFKTILRHTVVSIKQQIWRHGGTKG